MAIMAKLSTTKLLKLIFLLTLFSFFLGEIIRIDLGNNIILRPIDVGVGVLVFVWILFKFVKKTQIKATYILLPMFFFVASGLFSLIINSHFLSINQFFSSFAYLLRWAAYAGVYLVVYEFDNSFKKIILYFLLGVGGLIVAVGYIQYLLYPNLGNLYYLGWDEHLYRMFSVFLDPNYAGSFFVLLVLLLMGIFLKKKNILVGVFLALTAGAVFLTFSRSAIIMFVISSIFLLILLNKKVWIVIVLAVIIVVLLISSKFFYIENINLFRVASSKARLGTAANALKIIRDQPFFGIGFNTYRYAQARYGFSGKNDSINHGNAGTDNSFLFVLATTGISGLFFYIFMWFRVIKNILKNGDLKNNIIVPVVIASIAGIFTDSMFINSLFYPFIMFWLWVLTGLKENR